MQNYPVNPIAQLFRSLWEVKQQRQQQQQVDADRAYQTQIRDAQLKDLQERPQREQFNFYLQQYGQDPRGAFRAAYEEHPEFRDLATRLYGFQPQMTGGTPATPAQTLGTPESGTIGMGPVTIPGQPGTPGTFRLPGPPAPAFQTVGEMAQKFGYRLRPGVDSSLRIDQLPRNVDPKVLFLDPAEEQGKERQAAHDRLAQITRLYSLQQILSTPALSGPFQRDYETAFGQPFPTQRAPEMTTQMTPERLPITSTPAITGTGPGLVQAGLPQTQQIPTGREIQQQVPTGREINVPILPGGQRKLNDIIPNLPGKIGDLTLPEAKELGFDIDKILSSQREQEKIVRQASIFQRALAQTKGDYNAAYRLASAIDPNLFPPKMEPELHPLVQANIRSQIKDRNRQATQDKERQAPGGLVGMLTLRAQGHQTGNPQIDRLTPQQAEQLSRDPRIYNESFIERLLGGGPSGPPPAPAPAAPPVTPTQTPQQQGFPSLPDAKPYKGKTVRDTQTGKRYRSDGTKWVEVR